MLRIRKPVCGVFFAALSIATYNLAAQTHGPGPAPTIIVQAPPPQKRKVDAEVAYMKKRYDLSKSQTEKIRTVLNEEAVKIEAMLVDESLSPMRRIVKLKSLREEETIRVSRVLSQEQLDKYLKDLESKPMPVFQPPVGLASPHTEP